MGLQYICCKSVPQDKYAEDYDKAAGGQKSIIKSEEQKLQEKVENDNKQNLPHLIKVQSLARGFLTRKYIQMDREQKEAQPLISSRSQNRYAAGKIVFKNHKCIKILTGMPSYSNESTRQTLQKLGQFIYNQQDDPINEFQSLIFKDPCELENGCVYNGQWTIDDQREGQGTLIWKDGSIYEGYWKNDQANGLGRLIHANGDSYQGQWLQDKAHGQGIYEHFDGSRYVGNWKDDKRHGFGFEKWNDEASYEGNYESGYKHGSGKFKWANGSIYIGEFHMNNINGYGIYNWPDNRKYEGTWKMNQMNGKGNFFWNDGRKFIGEYVKDQKEGYGEFIWPNGRRLRGEWKNGKMHGKGVYINPQGVERYGVWQDGQRTRWIGS